MYGEHLTIGLYNIHQLFLAKSNALLYRYHICTVVNFVFFLFLIIIIRLHAVFITDKVISRRSSNLPQPFTGSVLFPKRLPKQKRDKHHTIELVQKRSSWGRGKVNINIISKQLNAHSYNIKLHGKYWLVDLCGR